MGKTFWRGMGNLRPSVMRGGLVESAPQSGEERGREHYGRKEERSRVRNEEKTYDYKGLLISLWRGVAWGSGVETGGTRDVPGLLCATHAGVGYVGTAWRISLLHDAMYHAGTGPGCSFGRVCLVPVPVPPSCLETRDTRSYIRPDGRLFFLSLTPSLCPPAFDDARKV